MARKLKLSEEFARFNGAPQEAGEAQIKSLARRVAQMSPEEIQIIMEEQLRATQKISEKVFFDGLTGIHNKAGFMAGLEKTIASLQRHDDQNAALLYIDLNYFKPINDKYGHAAGDEALRILANHIDDFARDEDYTGRLSGDEFAILLIDRDGHDPQEFLQSALARFQSHMEGLSFDWKGDEIKIEASTGSVLVDPETSPDVNMDAADQDMFRAKQATRDPNRHTGRGIT